MLDGNYQEIDSSPLAAQTLRFFEGLQAQKTTTTRRNFWDEECRTHPHLTKCKIYCD